MTENYAKIRLNDFQVSVGVNNAIAALYFWFKNVAPVFRRMRSKPKTSGTLYAPFSCTLSKLNLIAENSDWFIALFAPVVIGQSDYFWYWIFDSHMKTALLIPTEDQSHFE